MTEQRSVAVRLQDELAVARHNGARAMKDLYTAVSADLGDSQAALAEATRRADRTEREVARLTRQRNRLRGRLRRSRTRVRRLRRRAIRA